VTHAAAAAAAAAPAVPGPSAAPRVIHRTSRGRRLIQQTQQQHAEVLLALRGVPGAAHLGCSYWQAGLADGSGSLFAY
jgi:hypothetical protein